MTMTTTSCEGPEITRLGVPNLPRRPDCSHLALSAVAQARALKAGNMECLEAGFAALVGAGRPT